MASEQVLKLLRSIPLFADLDSDELMELLRIARPTEFAKGDVVCRQGDPGDCMYAIQAGEVSILIRGPDGQAVPVATLGPGDLLGEMTLVDDQPRSADVVAAGAVRAFRLDRASFEGLRAALNPVAFKVLKRIALTVCGHLRHVNTTVSKLVGGGDDAPGQPRKATGNVRTRRAGAPTGETRSFWGGLMNRVRGG